MELHSSAMAEGGSGGNQPPREPPRNLQGLLQMAVTAGTAEPAPVEPMSEEVCGRVVKKPGCECNKLGVSNILAGGPHGVEVGKINKFKYKI